VGWAGVQGHFPSQRWGRKLLRRSQWVGNALGTAGLETARRNINNLRYTDDTRLMAESKEELKSLLMKVKKLA